jgi:bifunctional non-homologous end joining protein LigD
MSAVSRELQHRLRTEKTLPCFEPCLPKPAKAPPAGPGWIHEIKHDGFRILAHRQGRAVRLIARNGNDFADRFPLAASAIEALPIKSCVIDGEAIVCDDNGLAVFDLIRGHGHNGRAILRAFDLLELDGKDLRRAPIEERKHTLANVLFRERDGIIFNQHYDGDGEIVFKQACALGYEGIVSKRLGSQYRAIRPWRTFISRMSPGGAQIESGRRRKDSSQTDAARYKCDLQNRMEVLCAPISRR